LVLDSKRNLGFQIEFITSADANGVLLGCKVSFLSGKGNPLRPEGRNGGLLVDVLGLNESPSYFLNNHLDLESQFGKNCFALSQNQHAFVLSKVIPNTIFEQLFCLRLVKITKTNFHEHNIRILVNTPI
jgi:hypothetical protein